MKIENEETILLRSQDSDEECHALLLDIVAVFKKHSNVTVLGAIDVLLTLLCGEAAQLHFVRGAFIKNVERCFDDSVADLKKREEMQ
jgi:hypothetical protein